jgi:hypothetical protein
MSLATLIKGLTSTDLGFEPAMVPTWITTSLPASKLTSATGFSTVNVDLGTLIDGVTDLGFRNVLANARRDLSIPVPTNDVFHALPTQAAMAVPSPAPVVPSCLETPPPAAGKMFAQTAPAPAAETSPTSFAFGSGELPAAATPFAGTQAPASMPFAPPATASAVEPPAPPPMPAAAPAPVQPMAGVNFGFATAAQTPEPQAPAPESQAAPALKNIITPKPGAFDPFATTVNSSWATPAAAESQKPAAPPASLHDGFSSDQLFGSPAVPTPAAPDAPEASPQAMMPPPVPSSNAFTSFQQAEPPAVPAPQAPAVDAGLGSFGSVTSPETPGTPPPMPATANVPAPKTAALGLTAATGETEQLMLRALLGVNETLTAERVVDLVSKLPGVTACACIHGARVIGAGNATGAAQDFQKQAADLSKSVQALIPLIGIEGAETFSLNTGERLITFAYHAPLAFGVLHQDQEPAAGLRDKITLVSRELSRMWSRSGARA